MSYIRLFLYTQNNEAYHLYLGIYALDRLDINLSALEKLDSWNTRKESTSANLAQQTIQILDNKNSELLIVGEKQNNPLPIWLIEWLQERGYHVPSNGMLKTITESDFTRALESEEIYYFGRNNLALA